MMSLNKREKIAALLVVIVLGVLILDRSIVGPLLERRAAAETKLDQRTAEMDRAQRLFSQSRRANQRWSQMVGGQLQRGASEAESQMLHAVRDWANESGLSLSSVKPERTEKEKDFTRITFRATGTGGMAAVSRFLFRIQTAAMPVRLGDVSISSRREGTDDLSLQVGVSTIHLPLQDGAKEPRP